MQKMIEKVALEVQNKIHIKSYTKQRGVEIENVETTEDEDISMKSDG